MNPDDTMDPIGIDDPAAPPTTPPPAESAGASDGAEAPAPPSEKQVPLSELVHARQRAEEAEARAAALTERVSELETTLAQAREALDAVERRQRLDRALMEADALDLESARLLTEVALSAGENTDIDAAVAELRRRKPFLFRSRAGRAGPAGRERTTQGNDALSTAAEHAARTGDRRALLRYLELRRNT